MTHLRRALIAAISVLSIAAVAAPATAAAPMNNFQQYRLSGDVWCC